MKLSKKLTTVTPFSKYLAMVLFIILPFVGFYLGIKYQEINYTISIGSQYQNQITKNQAEDIVKDLPEVKKMLDNAKNERIVTADERKDNWYVQVAEVVEDTRPEDKERTGHTATFNWYKIDKNNGKVICSWFYYDKNGKRLENKNDSDSCI